MTDLREIIAFYIDFRLGKRGHSALWTVKRSPSLHGDIFESVSKFCVELESDDQFSDILDFFNKFGANQEAFLMVLEQLLIGDLNWARVLSIVALSGALVVQCVNHGEENNIDLIEDWAISFVEVKVGPWIEANDGMVGLRKYLQPKAPRAKSWEKDKLFAVSAACGAIGVVVGLYAITRAV